MCLFSLSGRCLVRIWLKTLSQGHRGPSKTVLKKIIPKFWEHCDIPRNESIGSRNTSSQQSDSFKEVRQTYYVEKTILLIKFKASFNIVTHIELFVNNQHSLQTNIEL